MEVSPWYITPCQRNHAESERLFSLQPYNFTSHVSTPRNTLSL